MGRGRPQAYSQTPRGGQSARPASSESGKTAKLQAPLWRTSGRAGPEAECGLAHWSLVADPHESAPCIQNKTQPFQGGKRGGTQQEEPKVKILNPQ
jgi:hypothetical protein